MQSQHKIYLESCDDVLTVDINSLQVQVTYSLQKYIQQISMIRPEARSELIQKLASILQKTVEDVEKIIEPIPPQQYVEQFGKQQSTEQLQEVNEPEQIEPEQMEPELMEPDLMEPELVEHEQKELVLLQTELVDPQLIEPQYIEPELILVGPEVLEQPLKKIIIQQEHANMETIQDQDETQFITPIVQKTNQIIQEGPKHLKFYSYDLEKTKMIYFGPQIKAASLIDNNRNHQQDHMEFNQQILTNNEKVFQDIEQYQNLDYQNNQISRFEYEENEVEFQDLTNTYMKDKNLMLQVIYKFNQQKYNPIIILLLGHPINSSISFQINFIFIYGWVYLYQLTNKYKNPIWGMFSQQEGILSKQSYKTIHMIKNIFERVRNNIIQEQNHLEPDQLKCSIKELQQAEIQQQQNKDDEILERELKMSRPNNGGKPNGEPWISNSAPTSKNHQMNHLDSKKDTKNVKAQHDERSNSPQQKMNGQETTQLFKIDEEFIDQLARRVARLDTFIEQNTEVMTCELYTSMERFSQFQSVSAKLQEKLRSCLNKLYQVFEKMFAAHQMTRFQYCNQISDFQPTVRIEFHIRPTKKRDQKKEICENIFFSKTEVFGFLQCEMYSIVKILQKFFFKDNWEGQQSLALKSILEIVKEKIISIMRTDLNATKFKKAYSEYKDKNKNEIIT